MLVRGVERKGWKMPAHKFYENVDATLQQIEDDGLTKNERIIVSSQDRIIKVRDQKGDETSVLNFCANNYLGLANDERLILAAQIASKNWGNGLASVRFICGTQALHKDLESKITKWLGYEDCILFAACFDANAAVFEPLLGKGDAIISDQLNHASIVDGVRLCKANRYRFETNNMADLEAQLKQAREDGANTIMIVTDGVFSMDGTIANLPKITELAERYDALVAVDDCHATGVIGDNGRGSPEYYQLEGKVDILTGTLGKALGGAMGGFICARESVIKLLRQKARPYLFSNALSPSLVGAAIAAIDILQNSNRPLTKLHENAKRFRDGVEKAGFKILPGNHPIVPVMIGDAKRAAELADALLEEGIYVIGFSYPVVPKGAARVRVQLSAAHTDEDIDRAIAAFQKCGAKLGLIEAARNG